MIPTTTPSTAWATRIASPVGSGPEEFVDRLRPWALQRLASMYRPEIARFVFRERPSGDQLIGEGLSVRYTAIALIGLATISRATASAVLNGESPDGVCARLVATTPPDAGVGDRALLCWAARAVDCKGHESALDALLSTVSNTPAMPIVDLAWAVTALCQEPSQRASQICGELATRLMAQYLERARCFPHHTSTQNRLRSHVACFADLVYPILALAEYAAVSGDSRALAIARRTADSICAHQGPYGQWWWHYHAQTGTLVERYPVYAVHQHAMAPMALAALQRVSGFDYRIPISRGLEWLRSSPELAGGSLCDAGREVVWRKVARREPAKMSRYLQAAVTRVHPSLSWPWLDQMLPPIAIDFETRPYEWGWFLYAWPETTRSEPAR